MQSRALVLNRFGLEGLALEDRPVPEPGPGEALVKVHAVSLNRRDLLLVEGTYAPRQSFPIVVGSDAAGEVVAVGEGSDIEPGTRVLIPFFPAWEDGELTPEAMRSGFGGGICGDGVFRDHVTVPAQALVPLPDGLSFEEAATLPCAGATAWSALTDFETFKPGDRLLVQGTGGVSVFALQFARMLGLSVVITSSSDEKLEMARALGADGLVNYRTDAGWAEAARSLAGGPVDAVIDVGGTETLDASIRMLKPNGTAFLIGVLSGASASILLPLVVMRRIRLQGVTVASVASTRRMVEAAGETGLKPVIGETFPLARYRDAFQAMRDNRVFGKIVMTLD
ncbi:NAD(P)-dependent alcohol dehydrogenase [Rhizobiales bacterium]|uniref:zinc-dependent alcohol dehydrogenase family protein n=1 Tax=Hongsoonwoonella zoysiae TaxID=2821844 RepID=UPI0015619DCF|nr:NAD(P)-dependent alcohol dehydrogenase [Hongsoonwoonella zoysiae]NRG17448.1 NAD(P)-dependent alcohol dehydrogenase [Hongsoonwoonella zoysiae]